MVKIIIVICIVAALVVIGCIVAFVLFLRGGFKGAKEDKTLFEKGQISQEEYDSGYNQGAKEVVQKNYEYIKQTGGKNK